MSKHQAPGQRPETGRTPGRKLPRFAVYDELGDLLAVIKLQLQSAIQAEAGMPLEEDEMRKSSIVQADFARLSIRQISAELGSVLLDTLGLAATIEWYAHEFQKCTGIKYDLNVDDAAGAGLNEEYATVIFHVLHEALSNIAHHARAEKMAIKVGITPLEVVMVVWDNGVGIAEGQARNLNSGGLAKIRNYASSLEGLCQVVGVPEEGTTLSVSLPLAMAGGHRWETSAVEKR